MKKIAIAILLLSSPAMAQQGTYHPPQACYPIGKTANGELVFSMDCEKPPVAVTFPAGGLPPSQTNGAPVGVTSPAGGQVPLTNGGAGASVVK